MSAFWQALGFSVSIIAPIFALILLGWWFRRREEMPPSLVSGLNTLLFRYALPALLFFSVLNNEVAITTQWRAIAAGYAAVLLLYAGASWWGRRYIAHSAERGVFVQGVFRGNLIIVGLALATAVYGDDGAGIGAVIGGSIAFLLNILAVLCLLQDDDVRPSLWQWCGRLLRNPLMVAITLALVVKAVGIHLPEVLLRFGDYFTRMTLPLALLCTGATFDLRGVLGADKLAWLASLGRMLISPLLFVLCGLLFGVRGQDLGILFLMGAAPAATAGYVMAKAMGGNDVMAANIIAITTAGALILLAPIMAVLHLLGWM